MRWGNGPSLSRGPDAITKVLKREEGGRPNIREMHCAGLADRRGDGSPCKLGKAREPEPREPPENVALPTTPDHSPVGPASGVSPTHV